MRMRDAKKLKPGDVVKIYPTEEESEFQTAVVQFEPRISTSSTSARTDKKVAVIDIITETGTVTVDNYNVFHSYKEIEVETLMVKWGYWEKGDEEFPYRSTPVKGYEWKKNPEPRPPSRIERLRELQSEINAAVKCAIIDVEYREKSENEDFECGTPLQLELDKLQEKVDEFKITAT